MKYILLLVLLFNSFSMFAHRNCGAQHRNNAILESDPHARQRAQEIEEFTQHFIEKRAAMRAAADEEIIIPVVYHVVYRTAQQNISELRLIEQIEILNQDFKALNTDISKVPDPFKSVIGSLNVRFVLANRDPNGNPTTGINRYSTTTNLFNISNDAIKYASRGGANAWDPNSYLNIWIGNIYDENEGDLLGYASFPYEAGRATDGVALNYRYVGKTGALRPFNLGRTATHELGHYFNLFHIWGDEYNCTADDRVSDTPKQFEDSQDVPTFPKTDQCSNSYPGIMFMNFMDYSDDQALLMFTQMQANRMLSAIRGPRASLLRSKGYVGEEKLDVSIVDIVSPTSLECNNEIQPKILINSNGTDDVTSLEISMKMDNQPARVFNWTGVLKQNQSILLNFGTVEVSNGNRNITFEITKVNGIQDDIASNNTKSKAFKVGATSVDLPFVENFETNNLSVNGIIIKNSDEKLTWERSRSGVSSQGNYSYFVNNYDYDPEDYGTTLGQIDDIEFPFLDFSNENSVEFKFDVAAAVYSNPDSIDKYYWDTLQVLVTTDCGNTYDVLYSKFGPDLITTGQQREVRAFYPTNSQWRTETINLDQYAGMEFVKLIIRNISYYGNNIYVDNAKVNSRTITSVNNKVEKRDILIYPNPSTGQVTFQLNDHAQAIRQIQWVNTLGQIVLEQSINSPSSILHFDLSQQPKGVYIAKMIFDDGTTSTEKLLLN